MRIDRESLIRLLREACEADATDVHLKVPGRPALRVDGELVPTSHPKLLPDDTHRAAGVLLGLAGVDAPLGKGGETEFAFGVAGVGRFRVHIYKQRGSIGILIHRMAVQVPQLAELRAPEEWGTLVGQPGLILCSGSRRRDLLASLVHAYNQDRRGHVILLEAMMEYLHADRSAAISQREVGIDTDDWASGLRSALRQDPDVVVVGDIADRAVAELVLRAAEAGTSVLAGVPTAEPTRSARWFMHLFGGQREAEISQRVSEVLLGSLCLSRSGATGMAPRDIVGGAPQEGSTRPSPLPI